ncbi:MAG: Asp23/Gls24 family envelope stress response protein [Atopobiaceae bacterium]|nr:Asp23/Gls24 family envelope stress response protein [Atopobiaceae bacterium]
MSELENVIEDAAWETLEEEKDEKAAAEPAADETLAEGAAPEGEDIVATTEDVEDEEDLESEDSLTFSNGVIEKIVAIAMREVPGVVGMKGGWINRLQDAFGASDARKGVTVEVTPESAVRVNVSVLIEYGAYAPQVFEDVKKAVVKQVTGMTGLAVAGVNLRIEDVLTAEEIAARNAEVEPAAAPVPAVEVADDEPADEEGLDA